MICLPKELSIKLKEAAANGDISIQKLMDMSPTERSKLFAKHIGKDAGSFVSKSFGKAKVSARQAVLNDWITSTFSSKGKASVRKTMLETVKDYTQTLEAAGGVLSGKKLAILTEDLAMTSFGIKPTVEQVSKIVDLSKTIEKADYKINGEVKIKPGDDAHNASVMEFFDANKKMDDYMAGLNPTSVVKVALSTIGRGNMLMSPKSIALNIESNTVTGATEYLVRRASAGRISGSNPKQSVEYMKWANKIYQKTGYDITRMINLEIGAFQGEKIFSSQGKGVIRKVGRFYEDTIFKQGLGAPDVAYSSFAFADSADLTSTALAKKSGLTGDALKSKASKIFEDATSPTPTTTEGMWVREQAMANAMDATYTNKGILSEFVLKGLRGVLNKAVDGLGEVVIPFAKTPANVVELGLDYGGLGAVKAMYKITKGLMDGNKTMIKSAIPDAVRTGVGLTTATILASILNPDDFIGEYPTSSKEKALLDAKNATPNSIKIGAKYVSVDYFGVLAAPFVGIMRARKFGEEGNYAKNMEEYMTGLINQLTRVPGVEELKDIATGLMKKINEPFGTDIIEMQQQFIEAIIDMLPPRLIPGIISDIAKITDVSQRQPNYDKPLTTVQRNIPYWGQGLPEKTTVLGAGKKTEEWWSQLMFGARVKTAIDSPVIDEMNTLKLSGNLPALTNPEYTSPRFKALKVQLGNEEFREAMAYYGEELNKKFTKEIDKSSYEDDTPEDKKKRLNSIKSDVMDKTLRKYKYKKV